jgi:glucose/arabinose dehydrogenase
MRRRALVVVFCIALAAVAAAAGRDRASSHVGALPGTVKLTEVGRFREVTDVVAPPGDTHRLFVVEKSGAIAVLVDGKRRTEPFLDLGPLVRWSGNEQGLLSLVFAPDYADSGRFYVYYTDTDENARLVEYRRSPTNPNRADPATRREVLLMEQPSGEHYGGDVLFGPDRYLYLSVGDGGYERNRDPLRAQRLDNLHGKILRIDPRPADGEPYTVPRSNPFVGTAGALPEIWVTGLRNPWRFWLDPPSGNLYIGDVGENVREAIKYAAAETAPGTNFGWPCFEGLLPSAEFTRNQCAGAKPALLEYAREGGSCAVIGGVVAHDPRLPRLEGRYLYSDLCLGEILSLRVRGGKAVAEQSLRLYRPGVTTFGVDARNRIYIGTSQGRVYRLDPRVAAAGAGVRKLSGRELFLETGCGTCHLLAAAGTAGTYGPDLDEAKPSHELVVERVRWGYRAMPAFGPRLADDEIERIADFVASATGH